MPETVAAMIKLPELADGARLDPQPFESALLPGPAFRLRLPDEAADHRPTPGLGGLAAWASETGVGLVTARVPAAAAGLQAALAGAGFRAIERLVTLERTLEAGEAWPAGVRRGDPADAEPCAAIARTTFRHDRFHADPQIEPAVADALKARWVLNAFAGRADCCLVAGEPGQVTGFNLCLRTGDLAVIDLIAVAADAQGRGIGRSLVAASLAHYAAAGAARLRVGTQATNVASLALYRRAGFVPVAEAVTFHLVPRQARRRSA
jgi:ribosomal protein S18 acetylase RimI-like enzyme